MANPWFTAYYSEDCNVHFQAADWKEAVTRALTEAGPAMGSLEALELIGEAHTTGLDRHPS